MIPVTVATGAKISVAPWVQACYRSVSSFARLTRKVIISTVSRARKPASSRSRPPLLPKGSPAGAINQEEVEAGQQCGKSQAGGDIVGRGSLTAPGP